MDLDHSPSIASSVGIFHTVKVEEDLMVADAKAIAVCIVRLVVDVLAGKQVNQEIRRSPPRECACPSERRHCAATGSPWAASSSRSKADSEQVVRVVVNGKLRWPWPVGLGGKDGTRLHWATSKTRPNTVRFEYQAIEFPWLFNPQ